MHLQITKSVKFSLKTAKYSVIEPYILLVQILHISLHLSLPVTIWGFFQIVFSLHFSNIWQIEKNAS